MKTIEVTDEQFEELKNIAKELKTQDNRITQDPIWCVYEKREVGRPEDCGNYRGWVADEGMIKDDLAEELAEEWRAENKDEDGDLDDRDWEDILKEELGYREVSYDIEDVRVDQGQYYFTEKAAQNHLELNDHHYNKPYTYVESAWRNPEWVLIREVLTQSKTFMGEVCTLKVGDKVRNKVRSKDAIFVVKNVGKFKTNCDCKKEGKTGWGISDYNENWELIPIKESSNDKVTEGNS